MTSPIERAIDAAVRCVRCGGSLPSQYETVNEHRRANGEKVCTCIIQCTCGWFTEPETPCRNPKTKRCSTKMLYGKKKSESRI